MTPELENDARIPFILAAAGHRDLRPQDLDGLKEQVRTVLRDLRRRMPNTPLMVLSALAAGADQLIAEVALEPEWQATLVAVLPMPKNAYTERMDAHARVNLERLEKLARFTVHSTEAHVTYTMAHNSRETRIECYRQLAAFLVHQSQAVLALWDGKESENPSGTARVVQFALEEMPPKEARDHDSLAGLVYAIQTSRLSGDAVEELHPLRQLTSARNVFSKPGQKKTEARVFEVKDLDQTTTGQIMINFERFNRHATQTAKRMNKGFSILIPRNSRHRPLRAFLGLLESLYGLADAISLQANRRRTLFFWGILAAALAAALSYGIHADVFVERVELWLLFPFFIGTALVIHKGARLTRVENLYLDARALAEAIRVQFFWEMSGLNEAVDQYYLIHHHTPLDWIRVALRNLWFMRSSSVPAVSPESDAREVESYWVRNQADWYLDHARIQAEKVRHHQKISKIALWSAVLWSVIVPLSLIVPAGHLKAIDDWQTLAGPRQDAHQSILYGLLHVVLTVPALLAGGYRLWIEQAAYEEQAREYELMGRHFLRKSKDILQASDEKKQREALIEIGKEALKENGRWLLLHRERPLQVDPPAS